MTYFITATRHNGDQFTKLTDNAPGWLKDAIKEAHGDIFPDDYIYEWCHEAFNAYQDYDGGLDAAISDIEPEPYYNALAAWFSSHLDRGALVDQALSEVGFKEIYAAIGYAQVMEKERVYGVIFEAIKDKMPGGASCK